jgi:hypothetical protein
MEFIMSHKENVEAGRRMVEGGWGFQSDLDWNEYIKGMKPEREVHALLTFIASKIGSRVNLDTILDFDADYIASIEEHVFMHRENKHGKCPEFLRSSITRTIKEDDLYHYKNAKDGEYCKKNGVWYRLYDNGLPHEVYMNPWFQPVILDSRTRRSYDKWMRKSVKRKKPCNSK